MTNAKILELLTEAYKTLDEENRNLADVFLKNNLDEKSNLLISPGAYIGLLIRNIKANIYEAESKKANGNGILKAVKSILKRGQSYTVGDFRYAHWIENYTYISDGQVLVKIKAKFPMFEQPAEIIDKPIDFETFLKMGRVNNRMEYLLDCPAVPALRALIKTAKAEHKKDKNFSVIYSFGEKNPTVNAELLLDLLECIPEGKLYRGDGLSSMLYMNGMDGEEGVLCPIRVKQNMKLYTKADLPS